MAIALPRPGAGFGLHVSGGGPGNFTIRASGDTTSAITIYKQSGKLLIPVKTLVPQPSLIG